MQQERAVDDMRRWNARVPGVAVRRQGQPHARQYSTATPSGLGRLASNDPSPPLSLLRALLRECSYLPDDFVRQWMKKHIRASFRSTVPSPQHGALSEERLAKKFKDGRAALSQLQRAASGDQWRLQRVFMMAYDRAGKRRRELLRPLLRFSRSDAAPESSTTEHLSHTLSPQLDSLLRSQIKYSPPPLTRPNPRRIEPHIPELNSWLRPMPQVRVKNMKKKHYAVLLDRALPPVPDSEWERLRDLACGRIEAELPKRRRREVVASDEIYQGNGTALDVVVRYGKIPERYSKKGPMGALNQRTMRRLYAKVFSQCPLLRYDEGSAEWKVTWGEQAMLDGQKSMKD